MAQSYGSFSDSRSVVVNSLAMVQTSHCWRARQSCPQKWSTHAPDSLRCSGKVAKEAVQVLGCREQGVGSWLQGWILVAKAHTRFWPQFSNPNHLSLSSDELQQDPQAIVVVLLFFLIYLSQAVWLPPNIDDCMWCWVIRNRIGLLPWDLSPTKQMISKQVRFLSFWSFPQSGETSKWLCKQAELPMAIARIPNMDGIKPTSTNSRSEISLQVNKN